MMRTATGRLLLAAIAMAGLSAGTMGAVPEGYYATLEGKSGVELKKAVKAIIYDHEVISYGDPDPDNTFHPVDVATWTVFAQSDTRTVDDHLCWWDMYSAVNMWVSDGHLGLNIEHSVPNSWWGGKSGSTEAYNDLHHLNPSNNSANNAKSNWPLGVITGDPYWSNGVTTTGTPQTGVGAGATRVFEPYWSYKGDFARAYFYIFTIYDDLNWKDDTNWMYNVASDLLLRPWAYELLLEWNAGDAVSRKEMTRNDVVFGFQKNRNPFIDCPQLADHIWGSKQNEPFHYELYTAPEADPSIYPGWDETFADLIPGRWEPVGTDADLNEDEEYFIVCPTKNRAMTFQLISTGKAINECQYSPLVDESVKPAVLTAVPEDIATVKLENDGDYWYLGVYDPDFNFCGYINVSAKNNATLSKTKANSCRAKMAVDATANKTLITFDLNGTPYTLQYNSGDPRFAAYTSTQNPVQLYRAKGEVEAGIGATGLEENDSESITAIYDINGRPVASTCIDGLERGIYIVITNHGSKKIRK